MVNEVEEEGDAPPLRSTFASTDQGRQAAGCSGDPTGFTPVGEGSWVAVGCHPHSERLPLPTKVGRRRVRGWWRLKCD